MPDMSSTSLPNSRCSDIVLPKPREKVCSSMHLATLLTPFPKFLYLIQVWPSEICSIHPVHPKANPSRIPGSPERNTPHKANEDSRIYTHGCLMYTALYSVVANLCSFSPLKHSHAAQRPEAKPWMLQLQCLHNHSIHT